MLSVPLLAALAISQAKAADPLADSLRATQLTATLVDGRRESRFRATALLKSPGKLTVLTAGHCLSSKDEDKDLQLRIGNQRLTARVEKVICNPGYSQGQVGDAPGADNAVVVLKVPDEGSEAEPLRELATARIAKFSAFDANGRALTIRAFDQKGELHKVLAANYSNPRWLEWGSTYRPIPGDSGGGVFLIRYDADDKPQPELIGAVVVRSSEGGGASLLSRQDHWLDEATRP